MRSVHFKDTIFGDLNFPYDEGLVEEFTVLICGRETNLILDIWEDLVTEDNYMDILSILLNIEIMCEKARSAIRDSGQWKECIQFFFECQKVAAEEYMDKLELINICICSTEEEELDVSMDFSIGEDISDEVLVVCFHKNLELYYITHES